MNDLFGDEANYEDEEDGAGDEHSMDVEYENDRSEEPVAP